MAKRRDQDTAILGRGANRNWHNLAQVAAGRKCGNAAFATEPSIGTRYHELRIRDLNLNWRIIYRIDSDAIVITEVFAKKTGATPKQVVDKCKARLKAYDQTSEATQ